MCVSRDFLLMPNTLRGRHTFLHLLSIIIQKRYKENILEPGVETLSPWAITQETYFTLSTMFISSLCPKKSITCV